MEQLKKLRSMLEETDKTDEYDTTMALFLIDQINGWIAHIELRDKGGLNKIPCKSQS